MLSKRKRSDSKKSEKHCKKIKVLMNAEENQIGSLPNEIQLQILSKVPCEQLMGLAQLRLVCSQWRNRTASNEYGKLLCISTFGENCVSVRLSQSATDPNPERYVVVKSLEGYNDWIGYFKLRTLFGKYKAQGMPSKHKQNAKMTDTELSFNNIDAVLTAKQGSEYLAPMLLKLIPALVSSHSSGILVAKKACSLLTKTSFKNAVDLSRAQYVSGCLDVLKLSRLHLSLDPFSLYQFVMLNTYSFFNEVTTLRASASDVTQSDRVIFRKALIEMIHYGASESRTDSVPVFKEYFKQPFDRCFMNLLERSTPFKAALADEIVPTCINEFTNTSNWLVQRSALAVSHVTDCSVGSYFPEKMQFALLALRNPQSHPEVRRTAFLGMFYRAARNKLGPLIPATSFDDVFTSTVDAFVFLPDKEKNIAFMVLMMATFDYPSDLFTEAKLDALHTKLFEFLSSPNVLQSLPPEDMLTVVKNIVSVCWALKTKLKKYLRAYHEKIIDLIKAQELKHLNLEPEYWLAFYFDIGCFVSDEFKDAEAKEMIAAINQGNYKGIPVRKERFIARSEHAVDYLSQTPCDTIRQVLGMFPPHILKPTACTSVPHITKHSPKAVPVTKDQWDTYVQTLKQTDPKVAQSQPALVFKTPSVSVKKVKNGVKFDDKDITVVQPGAMKEGMQHIDFDNVVSTILNWSVSKDDLDPALIQQALHVLNAYAMWGVIKPSVLKAIAMMMIKLKPHVNDKQTTGYVIMIGTTLMQGSYLFDAMPDLANLVDHMLKFITPIPVVSTELLIVILKLTRYPQEELIIKGSKSVDRLARALELITIKWPRAAYHALMSPVLAFLPFFRTGDKRANLHWFWQLKMYGLHCLAALHHHSPEYVVQMLKEMFEALEGTLGEDDLLAEMLPKLKLVIELWERSKNRRVGDVSVYSQYDPDMQLIIKDALIAANKLPAGVKYYELF